MDKPISSALVQSIKHADLVELVAEYAQAGIDAAFSGDLLRDIPLASTIVTLAKVGSSFSDQLLFRKIERFLDSLNELSEWERSDMISRLGTDAGYGRRVGEHLVELLERIESHRKPAIVALIFAAYAKKEIDATMLHRLLHSVEVLPTFEIDRVRVWSDAEPGEAYLRIDSESLVVYASAGLAQLLTTAGGPAYKPNKVCETFLRLDLDSRSKAETGD